MALLGDAARFEQGSWYTDYRRYPFFADRAVWVAAQTPTQNKIAVAGCGWGFLVDELVKLDRDAYGFDAATYCTARAATQVNAAIASRIAGANVLTRAQMTSFRTSTVGLSGGTLIPLVVTEDLLPALTNAEVTTALTELRRIATKLCHIVTCSKGTDPAGLRDVALNWKTHAAWKALVGTDLVLDAETGAVL